MQLLSKGAPRISLFVNPATFSQHGEMTQHRSLTPVQYFPNQSRLLVSRKVEQDPIIVFRPQTPYDLFVSFGSGPCQAELCRSAPDDVGSPFRVTSQQLADCLLLSQVPVSISRTKNLFVLEIPNRATMGPSPNEALKLTYAPP
ncbi:MAG: hypothetical protein WBC04_10350 [Candidatus Acidiferrales bacterium]